MSRDGTAGSAPLAAAPTSATGPQDLLDLALPENDAGAATVRDYLIELVRVLWREEAGFDSKRPFGNSGWQYDLYGPMVKAGMVSGEFDGDGDVVGCDIEAADKLIDTAILALGGAR